MIAINHFFVFCFNIKVYIQVTNIQKNREKKICVTFQCLRIVVKQRELGKDRDESLKKKKKAQCTIFIRLRNTIF